MSTISKRQMAEELYDAGYTLFQQGRFEEALVELRKAEDAFRKLDARGHPIGNHLANGVSGLANSLALSGLSYLKLGKYDKAVTCFETSLINSKFEKKKPFQSFLKPLNENMRVCYEKELENIDNETLAGLIQQEPEVDTSFRFPFSLKREGIILARLYELDPDRYGQFKGFYGHAKKIDSDMRRTDKRSDEFTMKKMSFYIWGILTAIWIAYGFAVARALIRK